MLKTDLTKAIALSVTLGLCAPAVFAQEAPAADATATEAPAADAAPAAETPAPAAEAPAAGAADPAAVSMGAEAPPAEGAVGSAYIGGKNGDWELRCVKVEQGTDPCQMYQLLKDDKGNAVAEISLFPLPKGGDAVAGATIIAPLETLLTKNLTLQIDSAKPKVYPFTWCDAQGCIARVGFTAGELAALKGGKKGIMTIFPAAAPDQKVDLAISLSGFTASFDATVASEPKQ